MIGFIYSILTNQTPPVSTRCVFGIFLNRAFSGFHWITLILPQFDWLSLFFTRVGLPRGQPRGRWRFGAVFSPRQNSQAGELGVV